MNTQPNPSETCALILAGGRGTRIAAIHPDLPKPMAPVAGEPFLEWLFRRLTVCGFDEIVLATGHGHNIIADWVALRASFAGEHIRCRQEKQALGTGGAIAHCLPLITTSTVLILNGDTLLLEDPGFLLKSIAQHDRDGAIFVRAIEDTSRYGSVEVRSGRIAGFQEKRPGKGLISGGVYAFKTDWLKAHIPAGVSSFETDIMPQALAKNANIGAVETDAAFIDIGTPETLAAADAFVADHLASFKKDKG